jgi:hypothetical protein
MRDSVALARLIPNLCNRDSLVMALLSFASSFPEPIGSRWTTSSLLSGGLFAGLLSMSL